jgi:hypothetical protein
VRTIYFTMIVTNSCIIAQRNQQIKNFKLRDLVKKN